MKPDERDQLNSLDAHPLRCLGALLDYPVNGARFQCARRNVTSAINPAKHAVFVDLCRYQPAVDGFNGSANEIDGFIVNGNTGFGTTEIDTNRGEGRTVFIRDRPHIDKLLHSQAGNFATSAPTQGKGHHQDALVTQSRQIPTRKLASILPRTSAVIALALLRLRGGFMARTASRMAALTAGDESPPACSNG